MASNGLISSKVMKSSFVLNVDVLGSAGVSSVDSASFGEGLNKSWACCTNLPEIFYSTYFHIYVVSLHYKKMHLIQVHLIFSFMNIDCTLYILHR